MITVDGRCFCQRCEASTGDIYRMIGVCYNCGAKPILMLFHAGDHAAALDCPVCGNRNTVHALRLATPDEIPAVGGPPHQEKA
jgi:ssDNA-binding Zn-finger/Zn-ribbon topoisomerase 1